MNPGVGAIHLFPIKSCAPLAVDAARVAPRGLEGDRRWIVTDAEGRFLTARQHPRLTLIGARFVDGGIELSAPGAPTMTLRAADRRVRVTVWNSVVDARAGTPDADDWITRWLAFPARFAFMDDAARRAVNPEYGAAGDEVSFADGYPLLLISAAALDALNARLESPVPMLRFRPNLVVERTDAHAEDAWKRIRVGTVEFDVVKPCTRCVLTTVDFGRGAFDPTGEPLRTLTRYRRSPIGVTFGQNLIPRGSGIVRVGDGVEVLA